MPELPEVEVARRTLTRCVKGKTIDKVLVGRRQSIRTPREDDVTFARELRHRTIESLERRAKILLFLMDEGVAMAFHFKLGADVRCLDHLIEETAGVAWNFSDGTSLEFSNLALSEFHLWRTEDLDELPVLKSGIDPMAHTFNVERLRDALSPKKQVKAALTDQNVIGGIGNTYSDEILWNARISPFRKVSELSDEEICELTRQIRETLQEAIKNGGETEFTDASGRHGRYQTRIHGHEGDRCPRDGNPVQAVKHGRTTFWCPKCQV